MTSSSLALRPYLATLLCAFALLFTVAACGSDKGKVEEVNKLYGTSSKVWVTDKQTDAAGDKVKMTDEQKDSEFSFSADKSYTASEGGQTQSGTFTFDQAGKTITLTPAGSTTTSTFQVQTLTDDKLTLVGTSGGTYMLKAK